MVSWDLTFLTLWALFLLLINPKFRKRYLYHRKAQAPDFSRQFQFHQKNWGRTLPYSHSFGDLKKHGFERKVWSFLFPSKGFKPLDSLRFDEKQTQIDKALSSTKELFKQGLNHLDFRRQQTFGKDYAFSGLTFEIRYTLDGKDLIIQI